MVHTMTVEKTASSVQNSSDALIVLQIFLHLWFIEWHDDYLVVISARPSIIILMFNSFCLCWSFYYTTICYLNLMSRLFFSHATKEVYSFNFIEKVEPQMRTIMVAINYLQMTNLTGIQSFVNECQKT